MASPYAKTPAIQPRAPQRASKRNVLAIVLPVVAGLVMVGLLLVFLVLPIVIRSRCVSLAADRGVRLSVDHVDIGIGEVRLVKVAFGLLGVPQLDAQADDATVALSGLTPTSAALNGLSVAIDGPVDAVQSALDAWRATSSSGRSGAQKVAFAQAHLTWTKLFGQTASVAAPDVEGEIDAARGSIHLTAGHLALTAGSATFGPWRTTLERGADGTRTDIELDPVVHGGPTILYVRTSGGAASVKATVPRSPLSRLGFPPKALHLASDPEIEAQILFDETISGTATLTSSVVLSHATFSGVPIDATLRLRAAGDVTKGLDVKEGALKAGPLTASVSGTVKLFDDGARLALAWAARPIPCAEIGKQVASQALGGLSAQIGAIAQDLGGLVGLQVVGNAQASGLITLDSRDVNATSFTMTSNETCGLALF